MAKIRVGHSPDADDAFMFYALAKEKISSGGFEIEHVVEDIERLNHRAFSGELEVTALSCHAFGFLSDRYQLLPYGSSVGDGYGPIVVEKEKGDSPHRGLSPFSILKGARIAVPGRYTTAFLALQLFQPQFIPVFTPFDAIFEAVEKGEADFGLLIHEGQLTYREKGFKKIVDLGEWWKEKYNLPLPLGVNAIRRDLDENVKQQFARVFLSSLEYAFSHRKDAVDHALQFGRGIDAERGDRFVGMYVNNFSLDLDGPTREALKLLYRLGNERGFFSHPVRLEVFSLPEKLPQPTVTGRF